MAGFLWIPEKTTYPAKFTTIDQQSIFSANVDSETVNRFASSLSKLEKLRESAVNGHERLNVCITSEEALQKYYDQLHYLSVAIPPQYLQFEFTWQDAFGSPYSGISFKQRSISEEKTCVLFNLAALKSRLAVEKAESLSEGDLQQAVRFLRSSAGILQHIRHINQLSINDNVTSDLLSDTLQSLQNMMLGQAQECIFLKVYFESKPAGVLAKVAQSCGDLYAQANKLMKKSRHEKFKSLLNFKAAAFRGIASLYQAIDDRKNNLISDELARLELAMKSFTEANTFAETITALVLGPHWKRIFEMGRKVCEDRRHENEFILREKITPIDRLPPICGKLLVKTETPTFPFTSDPNLFENIPHDFV